MTQPSRTTESINRDNAAIRDIMLRVKELTVPDRATLAVGIIGHLATMMNRSQMAKLLAELEEEALRVQDVPPTRQRDQDQRYAAAAERAKSGRDAREAAGRSDSAGRSEPGEAPRGPVGQAGRGEFQGRLV